MERRFKELLEMAGLVMKKNRDVSELLNQRQDLKMAQQVSMQAQTEIERYKLKMKE